MKLILELTAWLIGFLGVALGIYLLMNAGPTPEMLKYPLTNAEKIAVAEAAAPMMRAWGFASLISGLLTAIFFGALARIVALLTIAVDALTTSSGNPESLDGALEKAVGVKSANAPENELGSL